MTRRHLALGLALVLTSLSPAAPPHRCPPVARRDVVDFGGLESDDLDARIERARAQLPPATPTCGMPTKAGASCRQRVKGGGPCWRHR